MGSRRLDEIVKVQKPYERNGGEGKEGSPMYLRVVGQRRKNRNSIGVSGRAATASHQDPWPQYRCRGRTCHEGMDQKS
jgi:hypothetical protein